MQRVIRLFLFFTSLFILAMLLAKPLLAKPLPPPFAAQTEKVNITENTPSSHKSHFFSHTFHTAPSTTLWPQIRSEFKIDHRCNTTDVKRELHWFVKHQGVFNRSLQRSRPYLFYIFSQAKIRHLPSEVILLPMIESAYDPFAYSPQGAAGLWQLMPRTGSSFQIEQSRWYDGRRDIYESTQAALNYLATLGGIFQHQWLLALAAYDSGEGTVLKAYHTNLRQHRDVNFWSLPLPKETHSYIPRLLALACLIDEPNTYHLNLPYIPNKPYLASIIVNRQLNLKQAAHMAEMPLEAFSLFNPGYNHWTSPPHGPHHILLPPENMRLLRQHLK